MSTLFKIRTIVLMLTVLVALFCEQVWAIPRALRVSFLDIGQGDSILIQTPHGRTVLIDGGPGTTLLERLGEELSFWQQDIDLMILTHPDLDHLEGLVDALKRFQVQQVMLTGAIHGSRLYTAFLELIDEQQISILLPDPSQDWQIDEGVLIDIIGPSRSVAQQNVESPNDASVALRVIYGQAVMMLSGDGEELQESELLRSGFDLRAQVFKAGHHGSSTSNDPGFVQAVDPVWSVVSSGQDNPFDHPHLDPVLLFDERDIEWWDTKKEGTITMASDGRSWWMN